MREHDPRKEVIFVTERNRDAQCIVSMSEQEKERFESAAKRSGMSLDDYLYDLLVLEPARSYYNRMKVTHMPGL